MVTALCPTSIKNAQKQNHFNGLWCLYSMLVVNCGSHSHALPAEGNVPHEPAE